MADEDAVVCSKIPGRVEQVAIDIGDVVRKGQTLVTLDRRELDLRLLQAQAQLRTACAAVGMSPEADESKLDHHRSSPLMLEQALVEEAQTAVNRARPLVTQRTINVRGDDPRAVVCEVVCGEACVTGRVAAQSFSANAAGVRRAAQALAAAESPHSFAPDRLAISRSPSGWSAEDSVRTS